MRKTLTITGLTILALTACAPNGSALGDGTDTGTHGILVPDNATKTSETTWQVPDAKHKDVEAWLEEKLPVNANAKELTYCDSDKTDSTTSWYWWDAETPADADGTPWLTVRVIDGDPVTVTVEYDPEDPGGSC